MSLPNLPTDNLYKFVTLSGVALMIAGAMLIGNVSDETASISKAHGEFAMRYANDVLERELAEIDQLLERYRALAREGVDVDAVPESGDLELPDVVTELIEMRGRVLKSRDSSVHDALRGELEALKLRNEMAGHDNGLALRAVWTGFGLLTIGIFSWFFLHQRLQDKLLQLEVQKVEEDLERTRQASARGTDGASSELVGAPRLPPPPA